MAEQRLSVGGERSVSASGLSRYPSAGQKATGFYPHLTVLCRDQPAILAR